MSINASPNYKMNNSHYESNDKDTLIESKLNIN